MAADPVSGQDVAAATDVRRRAQDSVRELVRSAGARGRGGRGWVVPLAATAAVVAAACAPVVWPLLLAAGAGSSAACWAAE
jgi:hypothetical protein